MVLVQIPGRSDEEIGKGNSREKASSLRQIQSIVESFGGYVKPCSIARDGEDRRNWVIDFSRTRIANQGLQIVVDKLSEPQFEFPGINGSVKNFFRDIDLSKTDIDDLGLRQMERMPITTLNLAFTNVTDIGVDRLCKQNRTLRAIDLSGTKVTSKGLASISQIPTLSCLVLQQTLVDDLIAEHLSQLSIVHLDLSNTRVTDEVVRKARLREVRWLSLSGTAVTDASFKILGGLSKLENLKLSDTRIRGTDLLDLKALTQLRCLDLSGTEATRNDVQKISAILPSLKVQIEK